MKSTMNRLAEDVLNEPYFIKLYTRIVVNFTNKVFGEETVQALNDKELKDILRFADILSNSNDEDKRNNAYKIISILKDSYSENEIYRIYANAILKKLGNFPSLKKLDADEKIPIEREIEFKFKKVIQRISENDDIYFTDNQYELFRKLESNTDFSFSGPTSMGKSFVIKQYIKKILSKRENICIVVPTRALIKQYVIDFGKELGEEIRCNNYNVVTNSNIIDLIDENNKDSRYIFVFTAERLLSFLTKDKDTSIGVLFIDEAHKIVNMDNRGLTYFTSVDMCINKFPNMKVFMSSPLISNPQLLLDIFNKKTGKNVLVTKESPVSQNIYYVDLYTKKVEIVDKHIEYSYTPKLLSENNNIHDIIYNIGLGYSNIVYANSKDDTMKYAKQFTNYLVTKKLIINKKEQEELQKLCKIIEKYIHKDYYLIKCLKYGVAYHYGTLPNIVREMVEKLFKEGVIKYLFCTSTLLEGVNLPVKNIFIVSNKIAKQVMKGIDFWNLAGRAGRLNYEFYGNVFCIKCDDKNWKDKGLLSKKEKIKVEDSLIENIKINKEKIKNLIVEEKANFKKVNEKEYNQYLSNIIQIDSLNNFESNLLKGTSNIDNEIIKIAKEKNKDIIVPTNILNGSKDIDIEIQNNIYKFKMLENLASILDCNINYDKCLKIICWMYKVYNWEEREKKLKRYNKKGEKNRRLEYIAALMNQWINDVPLSWIIKSSIKYYSENDMKISIQYKQVRFNANDVEHINALINNIISDIEGILKYDLEKYFNHLYNTLNEKFKDKINIINWATYLEFGTKDVRKIVLQNIGFTRNTANVLLKEYPECFSFKNGKLENVDVINLINSLNKGSIEEYEVKYIFNIK